MKVSWILSATVAMGAVAVANTAFASGSWTQVCEEGTSGCVPSLAGHSWNSSDAVLNGGLATDGTNVYRYNGSSFSRIYTAQTTSYIEGVISDANNLPWVVVCASGSGCEVVYLTESGGTWYNSVLWTTTATITNLSVGNACLNGGPSGCSNTNIWLQEGDGSGSLYEYNGSGFSQELNGDFTTPLQIDVVPIKDCANQDELHVWDAGTSKLYQVTFHVLSFLGSCSVSTSVSQISAPTGGFGSGGQMSGGYVGNQSGVFQWTSSNTWNQLYSGSCDGGTQQYFGANSGGGGIWCETGGYLFELEGY